MRRSGDLKTLALLVAALGAAPSALAEPDAPRARRPAQHAPHAATDNRFGWFGSGRFDSGRFDSGRFDSGRFDHGRFHRPVDPGYTVWPRYDRYPVYGYDACWYSRSWYPRYRWDCGTWESPPSTRFRLVEVDPRRASTQTRAALPNQPGGTAYHDWQRSMMIRGDAALPAASPATPVAPAPATPAPAPPASVSDTAPAAPGVDPWAALERGDWLAARDGFATAADSADPRAAALASAGSAVTLAMLGREDAAAWALRLAIDKDPDVLTRLPATPGVTARIKAAAERARAVATERPLADHRYLADTLQKATGAGG